METSPYFQIFIPFMQSIAIIQILFHPRTFLVAQMVKNLLEMIVYMFQCHSPKSSHPLPLPQSPKVHSTHLCLSFGLQGDQPINPKGNQPWILRADIEAEVPILSHLIQRENSLEKTLILGKIEGNRRRGQQRMSCIDSITKSPDMNLSKLQRQFKTRKPVVHGIAESDITATEWQQLVSMLNTISDI